jgi:uncharacterized protein (DUF488 family)
VLFERHKRLLAVLKALGGEVGLLDFQKLLFLYCQEIEEKPSYEFVPYKYGGFSFTSYDDKRRLVSQGLIEADEGTWKITARGQEVANVSASTRVAMNRFAEKYAELRGDALVAEAYRRYPFYAIRSEIAARVLANDPLAVLAIDAVRPRADSGALLTIGYEGRSIEGYLNILLRAGVTILCDVRKNAFSHKYGFSKGTLKKGCDGIGIRYEHLPELGIASDSRRGLESRADYESLFARYEREMLPSQTAALDRLRTWVGEGARVALTCFEHSPQLCHRHCVAEELERRWGKSLAARHL